MVDLDTLVRALLTVRLGGLNVADLEAAHPFGIALQVGAYELCAQLKQHSSQAAQQHCSQMQCLLVSWLCQFKQADASNYKTTLGTAGANAEAVNPCRPCMPMECTARDRICIYHWT